MEAHSSGAPQAKWLLVLALYDLFNALLAVGLFDYLIEE